MENKEENALVVRAFGSFSIAWQGKLLTGARTNETQFIYLLQMLLHYRGQGVSRGMLEEVLFGDRDIENMRHALRTILYNAKKRLSRIGLPDKEYIIRENDMYYWNLEIPVWEDAREFETLYTKAQTTEDKEKKLSYLLEAAYHYKGEFMPTYTSFLWVATEARRYRKLFCACMEEAVKILREKEDYLQMEVLGAHAAMVEPFSDWENVRMEALVSMKRAEEARELYAKTVDLYVTERGIHPSLQLKTFLEGLSDMLEHPYQMLNDIQQDLSEDRVRIEGGYLCAYPVFRGIYHMMERMLERGGQSIYLMLCTIVDGRGHPMKNGKKLDELSSRLGEAIQSSVRHGDVMTRYGKGQYLVLLVNISREDCIIVQGRINEHFLSVRQKTGVKYYINSVIYEPDERNVYHKELVQQY